MFSRYLFHLARRLLRGRLGRALLGLVFGRLSFALPVRWLRKGKHTLAFYHPFPVYPVHILIVPRRSILGLQSLQPGDQDLLVETLRVAQHLKGSLKLPEAGTRLVVNGGAYQDLPHLHFHLIVEGGSSNIGWLIAGFNEHLASHD